MSVVKKTPFRTLIAASLTLAGVLLIPAGQQARAVPGSVPSGDNRFGIVDAIDAGQAAYNAGASWEIVTLRWDEVQPGAAGQWEPDADLNEWISQSQGVNREVVMVLIGTPAWATDGTPGVGVPNGLYQPVSSASNSWAAFVRQAVSYYSARGINRYVIWRDMDIPSTLPGYQWEGDIEDYYQLVKSAYLVATEANPNAQIHLGGLGKFDPTWFGSFIEVVIDDPTAEANDYYFDVSTVHVFGSPEELYTQVGNHFVVMRQRSIPLKEVWINETNARPAVDPQVYDGVLDFREYPNVTLDQQASFIVQAYALGFSANRFARIATYRMVDDLEADDGQAFGLLRADGSERPAYTAYQLVTEQFSGFVYARRVDEETFPLIDYVRLTFENKVTHVVWAATADNATLIIPARSDSATLYDIRGNEYTVQPESGEYRVAVPGAECNDPVYGCLIGGEPWLLVEEGLADPLNETPPSVTVTEGGTPVTPPPGLALTQTTAARPTDTPTPPPTATFTPTATAAPTDTPQPEPTAEDAAEVVEDPTDLPPTDAGIEPTATEESEEVATVEEASTEAIEEAPEPIGPITLDRNDVAPTGFAALLPTLLMVLGFGVAGFGLAFFLMGTPANGGGDAPDGEGEIMVVDAHEGDDHYDEAYNEDEEYFEDDEEYDLDGDDEPYDDEPDPGDEPYIPYDEDEWH